MAGFTGTIALAAACVAMEHTEIETFIQPIALVVDDESLILMDTADILAEEGFAIVEASTANETFAFLDKHPSLQLLFTDAQMPGNLTGFALARIVSERWPHICVIVASGAARPGPDDLPAKARFIAKPISADLVHEVLPDHYHRAGG